MYMYIMYSHYTSNISDPRHMYVPFRSADLVWANWSGWSNQNGDCDHMNMKDSKQFKANDDYNT